MMNLTSAAIVPGQPIPKRYTCDGENISPPLQWAGAPGGTESFVLIMDDPDAPSGTFVHWLVYDLPAGSTALPENVPKQQQVPGGGSQGTNSARQVGYMGPCPPSGTHRYFFRLYALDTTLKLPPAADRKTLEGAMRGHILAQAELMAPYKRG